MKLRDHPLMSYKGTCSWPPAWLWRDGYENTYPEGEVGILREVLLSTVPPNNSFFLIMEHCGAQYMGALLLSDYAFYLQIYALLVHNCGETMRDIGEIDISHTHLALPASALTSDKE
jgi:hypothetical protein